MARLDDVAAEMAQIIGDYRAGEIAAPDAPHVLKWVGQFDEPVRLPILEELKHVLEHTYLSKTKAKKFLRGVAQTKALVGDDPCGFWSQANIMDLQLAGSSQTEVRSLFSEILKKQCGSTSMEPAKVMTPLSI